MSLRFIFDELCKGNLSVLTNEAYQFIADEILRVLNPKEVYVSGNIKETIQLLCMIGNILFHRTDLTVLPIVDEMYDRLINLYKLLDPHFQVGSAVVDFQVQAKKVMAENGEVIIDPLKFRKPEERDEVRQYYADRIISFDQGIRYTHDEVFGTKSPLWDNGEISKRLHDTKHNHPQLVGTLDKAKFVLDSDAMELDLYDDPSTTILERDFFWKHIRDGIITEDQELQMVLELKYDGISVEADCTDMVVSARTRGDTGVGEASDITPILYGYQFPRNNVLRDREVGVKFEAIIKYTDLLALNKLRETDYVNARMAIIGIMNSSDGYKYRDFITLVPLAVDRDDVPQIKDRMEEIELLNSLFRTKGEPLRYCYIQGNYKTCLFLIKKFLEEARYARDYLNFMFDGVVVSYLDESIRSKLGRENFVNKYSIAVKFNPLSVLTTFLGYQFTVGQSGNICPMIYYSPIEFMGTIHDHSSGSSLGRFRELALKVGDIIEVTYNNDVMPYVKKVDNEHNRQNPNSLVEFPDFCPSCGNELTFSQSGYSAKCTCWYCDDRIVARLTATLAKLGITGFAEKTILALRRYPFPYQDGQNNGVTNLAHIANLTKEQLVAALGEADGSSLYDQLDTVLHKTALSDYIYFGALGFSDIGKSTWKKIFSKINVFDFIRIMSCDPEDGEDQKDDKVFETICQRRDDLLLKLLSISGIGRRIVKTIDEEFSYFIYDTDYAIEQCNLINNNYSATNYFTMPHQNRKIIRFSGCRNRQLEVLLCKLGHDADGKAGVTRETDILIIPYHGYHSIKTEKMSVEAQIIPIVDFIVGFDAVIDYKNYYDIEKVHSVLTNIAKSYGIELSFF